MKKISRSSIQKLLLKDASSWIKLVTQPTNEPTNCYPEDYGAVKGPVNG